MTNDKDELFRKYVDGELSAAEQQEALHRFAEDDEMRYMLQFELKLKQSFREEPDLSSFEVPEGFSEHVMQEINSRNTTLEEESRESTEGWLDWLWRSQPVHWRPAYAIAIVAVLAVLIALPDFSGPESPVQESSPSMNQSVQTVSETNDEVWLRFVFIDDDANSVAVAGDFSNWEPVALTKQQVNGKPVWTGLVSMSRGEHRYMFVKNGKQWVTDPLAPMYREDGFGNKNAVIYL